MCNLYTMTATVDELRKTFGSFDGDRDNLPSGSTTNGNRRAPLPFHSPIPTCAASTRTFE